MYGLFITELLFLVLRKGRVFNSCSELCKFLLCYLTYNFVRAEGYKDLSFQIPFLYVCLYVGMLVYHDFIKPQSGSLLFVSYAY